MSSGSLAFLREKNSWDGGGAAADRFEVSIISNEVSVFIWQDRGKAKNEASCLTKETHDHLGKGEERVGSGEKKTGFHEGALSISIFGQTLASNFIYLLHNKGRPSSSGNSSPQKE